ncbi:MAG: hypothetical protein CMH58_06000 [Myxococcales bacterium]|nr:hypothetical protein [Myxococcales bacterium]
MTKTRLYLVLGVLLACRHGGTSPGPQPVDSGAVELSFTQAQAGAFRANPQINPVLPLRLTADRAETLEVRLGDETRFARRLDDGTWIVEFKTDALIDGVYTVEAVARSEAGTGRAQVRLAIDRNGFQYTDWAQVGTADSPQLHRHENHLYMTWTDRRDQPRGGYLQTIDGSGQGISEPLQITPLEHEVARMEVALGDGKIGMIYQQLEGDNRRHWVRILDLQGHVVLESRLVDFDGDTGRFQHGIAYDGEAWVGAWRVMDGDGSERIRWVRFSDQGILAGPIDVTSAGANDPHGSFLPYIQMRIAARQQHSVVSFNRGYWEQNLAMMINRNQVLVIDPSGEVVEEGILPHDLLMPFEFESHVHSVGEEIITLSTASSLADEALHEPHRIFASRVPEAFPAPTDDWDYTLVLDAPRTRGEMILTPHAKEWAVMMWTDERGRDQPGSPEDKIQVLTAPLSSPERGFRLGTHRAIPHAQVFSGMAKLSAQSLGSAVLVVWIDERNASSQQSRPEVFMEMVWF